MSDFIAETVRGKTLDEWLGLLRENDQQYGPVNRTFEELAADPHLQARKMLLDVTHPVTGKQRYEPGFALKFSRTPAGADPGARRSWGRIPRPSCASWAYDDDQHRGAQRRPASTA